MNSCPEDVLELEINSKNTKFLISGFYDSEPSEKFLKLYNEKLHNLDISGPENDCLNMILASDYFSSICSNAIDIKIVFSNLLKIDDRIRILIPEDLQNNSSLIGLWRENGRGRNTLDTRVSFVSKNFDIEDNDYLIYGLTHNYKYMCGSNYMCNLHLTIGGKSNTEIAENLLSEIKNYYIHKRSDYENINLNRYFRQYGIFINA